MLTDDISDFQFNKCPLHFELQQWQTIVGIKVSGKFTNLFNRFGHIQPTLSHSVLRSQFRSGSKQVELPHVSTQREKTDLNARSEGGSLCFNNKQEYLMTTAIVFLLLHFYRMTTVSCRTSTPTARDNGLSHKLEPAAENNRTIAAQQNKIKPTA